jgi:hypothetical protein
MRELYIEDRNLLDKLYEYKAVGRPQVLEADDYSVIMLFTSSFAIAS